MNKSFNYNATKKGFKGYTKFIGLTHGAFAVLILIMFFFGMWYLLSMINNIEYVRFIAVLELAGLILAAVALVLYLEKEGKL